MIFHQEKFTLPFALSQYPKSKTFCKIQWSQGHTYANLPRHGDPKSHREQDQYPQRMLMHQRFQDERKIDRDVIQGGDTSSGGILELAAMQRHKATGEIRSKEHRYGQDGVQRHVDRCRCSMILRVYSIPCDR